jgi:aspartate carbamoyltransferase catalytic subunit
MFPNTLGYKSELQTDAEGVLHHLLTLDGMSRATMSRLLDRAQEFADGQTAPDALRGTAVCTLFFEPSTRTRLSFQRAAQNLGADVLNFDAATSSTTKGETARDTLKNIEAMGVRGFVIRHHEDGVLNELARHVDPETRLVNAGDGRSAHPTQGLLDMLTLRQRFGKDFSRLKVAIVGDVLHSRVARSDLHALRTLGAGEIRICGPAALLPPVDDNGGMLHGCTVTDDFDEAIEGVDVLMMLRLQRERMEQGLVASLDDYHRDYGLTTARLQRAAAGAAVMHPGPINRGVEIDDAVADGPQSLILKQVANGVAVRMAVLESLLFKPKPEAD